MLTLELKNLGKGRMTSAKDPANSHTRMMSLQNLGKGFMTSAKDPANTHTRMMSLKNLGKGLKSMRTRTWKDSCVIQLPSQLSWYLSLSRKPMESNLCNVQTFKSHHYQLPHLCQTKNHTVVSSFFQRQFRWNSVHSYLLFFCFFCKAFTSVSLSCYYYVLLQSKVGLLCEYACWRSSTVVHVDYPNTQTA